MIPNIKLSVDDPIDNSTMHHMTINGTNVSYASVVGSLMYAMMGTRPDIAFLVGVLGRYSANPKKCHWEMVKRGLRYLKGTQNLELSFQRETDRKELTFHGFSVLRIATIVASPATQNYSEGDQEKRKFYKLCYRGK